MTNEHKVNWRMMRGSREKEEKEDITRRIVYPKMTLSCQNQYESKTYIIGWFYSAVANIYLSILDFL